MTTQGRRLSALTIGLVVLPLGAWAQAQKIEDGVVVLREGTPVLDYSVGTADRSAVHTETIVEPGSEFLRIHFTQFNLAPGDYLTITDPDGEHLEILEGLGPHNDGRDIWSFAVPGDTAILTLHAGPRRTAVTPLRVDGPPLGYAVDKVIRGLLPLKDAPVPPLEPEDAVPMSRPDAGALVLPGGDIEPLSVCGSIGYRNVACITAAAGPQRPVARLLSVNANGTRSVRCTGWLVRGSNANTLITNNHCFSTAAGVRATEAQFNHQTTTCTGTTLSTTQSFRGNTLLRTVGQPLDYTLMTMLGNPEATWGELIPARRNPVVGELIWIIQHPSGQPKKIGHWENSTFTGARCDVEGITSTQINYSCDTEGGSSGSVVLQAGSNLAIGLHHLGGCPNQAARMSNICTSAGSLLTCQ